MKSELPYYQQIKMTLKRQILSMKPDDRIPSENELMKSFSVSRGTVKQAIVELVFEGVLYRKQGKGTFVSPIKINRSFDHLPSFTNDIIMHGMLPANKTLRFDLVQAQTQIAEKLNILRDTQVLRYKRIVLVGEEPLAVVCSYLRCDYFPNMKHEHIKQSFYAALMEQYKIVPLKALDTYSVIYASPKTAGHLHINENDALIYSERIGYLADNTPVEYVESFIRADKYKLTVFAGQDNNGKYLTQVIPHFEHPIIPELY